jgi:plasmid segregation protein ParM
MSIDPGKYELKSIGRNTEGNAEDIKKISFRTKIYNMSDGYIDIEGNSHKVEYDGQTLIVGEQGEVSDDAYETSKTSKLHQVCAYTAISQYLKPGTKDNKISIVLACPISVLKVESAKEEYKNFIKNSGTINIKVDDKDYTFDITDITIKAEDTGIKYSKPELFENTTVALIGFGGLNMNFQLFRNGVCKSHDRFAEEFGATTLATYVKEDLTAYRKGNIVNFEEAEESLNNGYSTKAGEIDSGSVEIIKNSKERFVNDALKIISRNGYKLESIKKIVFVGGTINKFDEILKNILPHSYIADDSQWATADGLYRVAAAKNLKK